MSNGVRSLEKFHSLKKNLSLNVGITKKNVVVHENLSIKIGKQIGKGGFSLVFIAAGSDGRNYAVKVQHVNPITFKERAWVKWKTIRKSGNLPKKVINADSVERETECLRQLGNNYFILRLFGTLRKNSTIWVVTEICPTDLGRLFLKADAASLDDLFLHLFTPIFFALNHIHANSYVHRDVKPLNILINLQGIPKLTDFGFCAKLQDGHLNLRTAYGGGTAYYAAPEILQLKDFNEGVDSFALALSILSSVRRFSPKWFFGSTRWKDLCDVYNSTSSIERLENQLMIRIKYTKSKKLPLFSQFLPVLIKMMNFNSMDRLKISEVCKMTVLSSYYENWKMFQHGKMPSSTSFITSTEAVKAVLKVKEEEWKKL